MKRLLLVLAMLLVASPAFALNKQVSADANGGTIEEAIALVVLAGGGVVTLDSLTTYTSGTDFTAPLYVPTGVVIRGKGRDRTKLAAAADADSAKTLIIVYGIFSGLEDLTVIGGGTEQVADTTTDNAREHALVEVGRHGFISGSIRFSNMRVVNAPAWGIYVLGTTDSASTLAVQVEYENVDFINQANPDLGDIKVGTGCTTQWFTRCVFGGQGKGLWNRGTGTRIRDCTFESTYDRACYFGQDASNTTMEGCWFETTVGSVDWWFVELTGSTTRGFTMRDCIFTRTGAAIPRMLRTAQGGAQRNIVVVNPLVVTTSANSTLDGNDILLQNDDDDLILIGGSRVDFSYDAPISLSVNGSTTPEEMIVVRETSQNTLRNKPLNTWPVSVIKGKTP